MNSTSHSSNMPKVSFIVPCYKLAHFLPECISSILSQTYENFEILIMDDCSPDNTPEVANSFKDPRVIHVRNDENLRHLRNYNKGIELARGEYVWLISADDYLSCNMVLERFVDLLERNPTVGFVYCPAIAIVDGVERGKLTWCYNPEQDFVASGRTFLRRLIKGNCIAAPTGLVRRTSYNVSTFPLDMPHAGDWYLWCLFALHFDVGYLAKPMVNYRLHEANMTNSYTGESAKKGIEDEVRVLWRIRAAAIGQRDAESGQACLESVTAWYVDAMVRQLLGKGVGFSAQELRNSLAEHGDDPQANGRVFAAVMARSGDHCFWNGNLEGARSCYADSIRADPRQMRILMKLALVRSRGLGTKMRKLFASLRNSA